MVDADIVKTVIDSNRGDYIKIAIGIFYETKKYPNIQVGIDVKNITINDRVVGYEIKTNKNCNLIASDLFYHITQLINDPTIENVTINDTNMFEIIKDKENLTDDIKEVVNNYDPHVLVSQQSTQLPSFIPIQKSSQQTAHREAKQQNDQSLQAPFVGQVCELMKQYGTNLPIREHKGLAQLGNTCYLNTAMQCLNACPEFVAWVLSLMDSRNEYDKTFVSNVIHIIQVMRGVSVELKTDIITQLQDKLNFTPGEDDCSGDFINKLITKLQENTESINVLSNVIVIIEHVNNTLFDTKDEIEMNVFLNTIIIANGDYFTSPPLIIMFTMHDGGSENPVTIERLSAKGLFIFNENENEHENVNLTIGNITYNYELVAMSVHIKIKQNDNDYIAVDHYTAYAKHNGVWWKFDDKSSLTVTVKDMKGTPSILFYRYRYTCPSLTGSPSG